MTGTALVCVTERGFPVTVLHVDGPLGFATAPVLRQAVLKLLTDQPELLLIDVGGVTVVDDITLTAFPMLVKQAAAAGVTVMLFEPSVPFAAQLGGMAIGRQVPIFATRAAAVAAFDDRPAPPRMAVRLPPEPDSTAGARDLVERSCRAWRIGHLTDTASLIMTELVANAIAHARTPMLCSVTVRQRHLFIAVRDGSRKLPQNSLPQDSLPQDSLPQDDDGGRGLLIIEGLARSWGCVETTDGKVVWATLPLRAATVGS